MKSSRAVTSQRIDKRKNIFYIYSDSRGLVMNLRLHPWVNLLLWGPSRRASQSCSRSAVQPFITDGPIIGVCAPLGPWNQADNEACHLKGHSILTVSCLITNHSKICLHPSLWPPGPLIKTCLGKSRCSLKALIKEMALNISALDSSAVAVYIFLPLPPSPQCFLARSILFPHNCTDCNLFQLKEERAGKKKSSSWNRAIHQEVNSIRVGQREGAGRRWRGDSDENRFYFGFIE